MCLSVGCAGSEPPGPAAATTRWEIDNPAVPLPEPPLGTKADFAALKFSVTPEKVRLGRLLFFDGRLSSDGTVSCATCHRPGNAFSEPTAHSTGVGGKTGNRKSPTFINGAWASIPVYFWDGRAASMQEQAAGPMDNPVEMGNTHEMVVDTVRGIGGYRKAFKELYGDEVLNIDRIADAIAAYETTRMSGNSAWDRYKAGDQTAVSEMVKLGDQIFFGKGLCAQCHAGWNLTDSGFHNIGIGWDPAAKKFADQGRGKVSGKPEDTGAFKTPTLRDIAKHAPYMHDGSIETLREVVAHYDKGGNANPWLSGRVKRLGLTRAESEALVAMMVSLNGVGYQDTAPKTFPD
jgi:cytochrome c peroxidase